VKWSGGRGKEALASRDKRSCHVTPIGIAFSLFPSLQQGGRAALVRATACEDDAALHHAEAHGHNAGTARGTAQKGKFTCCTQ
jgi:hypothetical protein